MKDAWTRGRAHFVGEVDREYNLAADAQGSNVLATKRQPRREIVE